MSIATSQDGFESLGDEDSAALPPSGMPALPDADPELMAMFSWAAESIRHEWNPPPCPKCLRLDDRFPRAARADCQHPLRLHWEVTSLWRAPLPAQNCSGVTSILTALDGGVAKGYAGTPPMEHSEEIHPGILGRSEAVLAARRCLHTTTGSAASAFSSPRVLLCGVLHSPTQPQQHSRPTPREWPQEGGTVSLLPTQTSQAPGKAATLRWVTWIDVSSEEDGSRTTITSSQDRANAPEIGDSPQSSADLETLQMLK